MRTTFRAKQPYTDILMKAADKFVLNSPAKPVRFIEKMIQNKGVFGKPDTDGLQRKNPVIVGFGDSVTAGRFEDLISWSPLLIKKLQDIVLSSELFSSFDDDMPTIEISDCRESYLEKFRNMLIDKYEQTSVSVINAGIAGDNLIEMEKRAERDIIRYQPDLVLINGSLNWHISLGSADFYKALLRRIVQRIKNETTADIILLTPNGALPNKLLFGENAQMPDVSERAQKIREVAEEEHVCLADVFAVWENAKEDGCPWERILANGINHPGVEGHEVYAMILMKLFEEQFRLA